MNRTDLSLSHPTYRASAGGQVYTDLNSLQNLKQGGEGDSPEALRKVAQQFESLFISMMLKSMRDANAVFEEGNPFNSSESKMYRDMLDSQMAVSLAESGGMGLAEVLMRQLDKSPAARVDGGRDRFGPSEPQLDEVQVRKVMEKVGIRAPAETADVDRSAKAPQSVPQGQKVAAMERDEPIASPLDFIRKMMPYAREVADKLGISPKILVAQSALETGWGQKMIQGDKGNSFNLFGIKADSRWSGDSARVTTTEYRQGVALKEQADFRAYDSFQQSFEDYLAFLQQNARYQQALEHGGDAGQFLQGLQRAGYATDPAYADKILTIANNELFDEWK
ncbi:flagellar assembly peptidoglycan hydrolase FlgJ [Aestuariirhabdus litorea]|uniref:Peptidoglycan hydrolase FlgJ n=1 Tax=Aestuariirhabdus litorea TaxID=2528527 RepID=A0A3P3VTK7_9GAMM|nr:flagellar assembly peptidoglycan hydrolase FlgJ [Aestuariirhabdus litorea]RRJ85006.1 flagellar assembly peptidoglycan hydrolase FlgJ [Aestuariirhabdus litorea]RWW98231.1 flagellar assembly peptidoglycan hydrolase FlgJ [Endozoicomonadaceae bacterium GTF-13]